MKMNKTNIDIFTVYVETSTADTEWEVYRELDDIMHVDESVYTNEIVDKIREIAQMSRKNSINQNYIVVNPIIAHVICLSRKLESSKLSHKLKFVRKELNELFGK